MFTPLALQSSDPSFSPIRRNELTKKQKYNQDQRIIYLGSRILSSSDSTKSESKSTVLEKKNSDQTKQITITPDSRETIVESMVAAGKTREFAESYHDWMV